MPKGQQNEEEKGYRVRGQQADERAPFPTTANLL